MCRYCRVARQIVDGQGGWGNAPGRWRKLQADMTGELFKTQSTLQFMILLEEYYAIAKAFIELVHFLLQ